MGNRRFTTTPVTAPAERPRATAWKSDLPVLLMRSDCFATIFKRGSLDYVR